MNKLSKPVKLKNVIYIKDLPDYNVLFQPLTAETIGLNESGLTIWEMIDGKNSIAYIAAHIKKKFSLPAETALNDVSKFADTLYRRLFILKNRDEYAEFENR